MASPAFAQESGDGQPGYGVRALPALAHLPTPTQGEKYQWAFAAQGGVGYIDSSGESNTEATRLLGGLAASFSFGNGLWLAADLNSRVDLFSASGENTNLYGEPRLAARYVLPRLPGVDLGVEADVRFVGQSAPSIEWAATSPSLSALVGIPVGRATYLSGIVGFHLDLSKNAVEQPENASPGDRLTLGASCCPAVRLGVGVDQRFGRLPTEWLAEITTDILVGSDAPSVFSSPWTLSLGARHPVARTFALQGILDLGLSARPAPTDPLTLVPIEPRIAFVGALTWTPGKEAKPNESAPPPPPKEEPAEEKPTPAEEAPAPVPTSEVTGLIVDEAGQGMSDVSLTLVFPDGQTRKESTFADGTFSFADVPENVAVRVDIKTPGYDAAKLDFGPGGGRHAELVLYPSLPAGQVRGSILDLQGAPVQATVTISPSGTSVEVSADGSFEVELPPGRHILKFEHEGFVTQQRVIEVEERGVVILNIALTH